MELVKLIILNVIMIYFLRYNKKYIYLIMIFLMIYYLYLNNFETEGFLNYDINSGNYIPNSYVSNSTKIKKYIYGFHRGEGSMKEMRTGSIIDYLTKILSDEVDKTTDDNYKTRDDYKLYREKDIIYDYHTESDDNLIQYKPRKVWVDGPERNLRLDYDRDTGMSTDSRPAEPSGSYPSAPGKKPTRPPPPPWKPPNTPPPSPIKPHPVPGRLPPHASPTKKKKCTNVYLNNALPAEKTCPVECTQIPTYAMCKDPSCTPGVQCYRTGAKGKCGAEKQAKCTPNGNTDKATFCPMPPAAPVIYSPGPNGGWLAKNPPKRLLNFTNNTEEDIVIIGMLGDAGYYGNKNPLPESWSWLTDTTNKYILGDKAGIAKQAGWNAFVITSLDKGQRISIIFPLLEASYSRNLKKGNKFGLSGGVILAVKNDGNLKNGLFSVATKNVTRFEYTFQLTNDDKVSDFPNLSAIPQGCGGHLNCNATNFNSKTNINWGESCIDVPYSYDFTNNNYYYGETDSSNQVVAQKGISYKKGVPFKDPTGTSNMVGPFVCGFPQVFSQEVVELCNKSSYSNGVKTSDPGGNWQNKKNVSNIKNCGITSAYQCMLNQLYYNNPVDLSGMGINYDLVIKSGDSTLKSLITPTTGGYDKQKTWDIACLIEEGAWLGAYGYPYQEELESNILNSNINTTSPTKAYKLEDLVIGNTFGRDKKIESTWSSNSKSVKKPTKVSITDTVVYDLTYYPIGSGSNNKKSKKCILST